MADDTMPLALSLVEGLRRWGERKLVKDIELFEKTCTDNELEQNRWPRLCPPGRKAYSTKRRKPEAEINLRMLSEAWNAAVRDLSRQIVGGILELRGSRYHRSITMGAQTLPRSIAQQHLFDFVDNKVFAAGKWYFDITVLARPVIKLASEEGFSGVTPSLLPRPPFRAIDLPDAHILAILNEHYERVKASPGPKMMARIKNVLQPFINARMEYRAEQGLLASTLAAEARALRAWIGQVAPWHPIPQDKTVMQNIRLKYRLLKARSKG